MLYLNVITFHTYVEIYSFNRNVSIFSNVKLYFSF